MNMHKNARLTPRGRERIAELPANSAQMAEALKRYDSEGIAGLEDRSSRPHRLHRPTPQLVVERIEALRRQRPTGKAIAAEVGVSEATVSRILGRLGLNKLGALEPAEPVLRYEREKPGELIHLDVKNKIDVVAPERPDTVEVFREL
jgi:DNA-binding MarR family transcriptional regulator